MDKQEFLTRLRLALTGMPQADIDERLGFYSEMIDDRVEEGLSESEAVAELGPVDEIVAQILAETPLTKLVRERVRPTRRIQAWEIVLLVLGFPLWFPLLIAAFAVFLSVYIVIWAVIVTLWAVELSLAVTALALLGLGVVLLFQSGVLTGVVLIGAAAVLAGLAVFFFFGCRGVTRGALWLTKKIALWIKSLFLRKESAK